MKLIIVESPTKAKTLTKFLGSDYQIEATMGHLRDLPEKNLGVEIKEVKETVLPVARQQFFSESNRSLDENGILPEKLAKDSSKNWTSSSQKKPTYQFLPQYEEVFRKKETIKRLCDLAKKAEKIILATDPDREGEAIAWHVAQLFQRTEDRGQRTDNRKTDKTENNSSSVQSAIRHLSSVICPPARIVFHEITESAIKEALANPKTIDINLVDSQQARRILDRLVGYKLSPILWKKIRRGLSAGRVQSIAVRFIVEREKEIKNFQTQEYWRLFANLKKDKDLINFELIKLNGENIEQKQTLKLFDGDYTFTSTIIKDEKQAQEIINDLSSQEFIVKDIQTTEFTRTPLPAFTTSTLQQEANRRFGFTAKRTMNVAQKLYEEGKITYHRTDSVVLSKQFMSAAQKYINQNYGKDYALDYFRQYKTKQKLAQEAHEAIRPTNIALGSATQFFPVQNRTADSASTSSASFRSSKIGGLPAHTTDEDKLYDLIWKRALATQMQEASLQKKNILVTAGSGEFLAEGIKVLFKGFLVLYEEKTEDKILPEINIGEKLILSTFLPTPKKTEPPPRYSEASLIKALEERGIGRPSTYAPIITTIESRQYVEKIDSSTNSGQRGRFLPTALGQTVNDFLVKNFPQEMEITFTAQMEDDLDNIAQGKGDWQKVLSQFYAPFNKKIEDVDKNSQRAKVPVEQTSEKCEKCGKMMVIRLGRFGKFLACSGFPKCKNTKPLILKTDLKCPRCNGDVVIKKTKRGRKFFGCSSYPKCDFASWRKEEIKPVVSVK